MNALHSDLPAPEDPGPARRPAWSAGDPLPDWEARQASPGGASWSDEAGKVARPRPRRPRFLGPGILESLVWAAGFMFTQVFASMVLLVLVLVGFLWSGGQLDFSEILRQQQGSPQGQQATESSPSPGAPAPGHDLPIVAEAAPATTPQVPAGVTPAPGTVQGKAAGNSPSSAPPDLITTVDLTQSPGMRAFRRYLEQRMAFLLWGAGLATALYAVALTRLRLGVKGVRDLGWHLPRWQHLLTIGLLVLPLSLVASTIQQLGFDLWPSSKAQMESLFEQMRPLPLVMIWIIIAFAPAVSEELLFRGVIGRGLLARHGFVPGVLLTSFFFGGMHLNPAQVMGVIPIGIALHLVYRVTRSFWAPMLLHFLNNAFAGLMLKLSDHPAVQQLGDQHGGGHTALSCLLALGCVGCLFCWMWQTRTEYVDDVGFEWDPSQPDCGVPPPHAGYRQDLSRDLPWGWIAGSLVLLAGMLLTMTRSGGT